MLAAIMLLREFLSHNPFCSCCHYFFILIFFDSCVIENGASKAASNTNQTREKLR
jgi:hypothetical protein